MILIPRKEGAQMNEEVVEFGNMVYSKVKNNEMVFDAFVYNNLAFNVGFQGFESMSDFTAYEQSYSDKRMHLKVYDVMCVDLIDMMINTDASFSLCCINDFMGVDIHFPYSFKSNAIFREEFNVYNTYEQELKNGVNVFVKEDTSARFGVIIVKNDDDAVIVNLKSDTRAENNEYDIPSLEVVLKTKGVFIKCSPLMIDSVFKTLEKTPLGKITYDYIKTCYTRFDAMSDEYKQYAKDLLGVDNYKKCIKSIYEDEVLTVKIKTPTGATELYDTYKSVKYNEYVECIGDYANNFALGKFLLQKINGSKSSSLCSELFGYLVNPTNNNLQSVFDNTKYAFFDCGDFGVVFFDEQQHNIILFVKTKFGYIEGDSDRQYDLKDEEFANKENELKDVFCKKCATWMKLTNLSKYDFYMEHRKI